MLKQTPTLEHDKLIVFAKKFEQKEVLKFCVVKQDKKDRTMQRV